MYQPRESQSLLGKWQLGMDRLAKSEAEPALLGLAMSSIHGALEDQFRHGLASLPQLSTAERIRVKDRKEVNWPQLRDLMQKYAGLSDRDAKYIMQMNSIRNEAAHGGEFRGNHQDVAAYAEFVKKWLDLTETEWLNIAEKECLNATENTPLHSNCSFRVNHCPRCQSIRIKSLEVIYHRGISVIERGRGKVQTRQSSLSLQAAPPQRKRYIPAIGPGGLLVGFFLLPFAGFLMLLLLIWFYRVWRFNKIEYPRLMKEWHRTFKCEQCAHTFRC